MSKLSAWESNSSIKRFREYLRIPSFPSPEVDYDASLKFLKKQAEELDLPYKVVTPVPNKPIIILTWNGTQPELPSILLNSHMDVVPVYPENWKYPPFEAHLDENGNIYGRGAQDMKCVAIQYLEAIRRFKEKRIRLKRTIHLTFVPEEEKGGKEGMQKFILTDDFRALNIGLSLDEGISSPRDDFLVYNAERSIWHMALICPGTSGHGSLLIPNTAGEKVRVIIDKFMDYRKEQKKILEENPAYTVSNVTTVNLTMMSGGVQHNVVPESLTVVFDIRLAVDVDHIEFEKMVKTWCESAGEGIRIEYEQKDPPNGITKLDESNPFWVAFKGAADELDLKLTIQIFPGGTDSRFLRLSGISAIGFSPINNTLPTLHAHNEYLHADTFLKGIDIYEKLIPAVANI